MPYADAERRREYQRAYSKRWAEENREAIIAAQHRWATAHPDAVTAKNAAYHAANSVAIGIRHRRTTLERKYSLTQTQYAALADAQGGVCLICRQPETMLGSGGVVRPLSVDHDHRTGSVRGLLCAHCNAGLGHFEDDPDILAAARLYLIERSAIQRAEVA